MLLDRKHKAWAWFTVALAVIGALAWWFDPEASTIGRGGSTIVGLTLGSLALLFMLFCVALSLKRRVPHWRLGRAQAWMRGHIWLGLLSVWFVALHGAFERGGPLTTLLWVLIALVTLSAVFGLILQQFVPRLLLHSVPGETLAQQMDRELEWIRKRGEEVVIEFCGSIETAQPSPMPEPPTKAPGMPPVSTPAHFAAAAPAPAQGGAAAAVATAPPPASPPAAAPPKPKGPPVGGEPLRRFYVDYARPFLAGEYRPQLASPGRAQSLEAALRTMCPAPIQPGIDAVMSLCDRARQLRRQRRLMRILFAWLILHIPLSWALIVLAIVHAVFALRFLQR